MAKGIIGWIIVFLFGAASCYLLLSFSSGIESPFSDYFSKSINAPLGDIARQSIEVYSDRVIINVKNAGLGKYASTGSMLPTLSENTTGIRIVPKTEKEINVGDIISFEKSGELIIHRVIEKGLDSGGIYFITKGDNADFSDGKTRFKDIKYKTIGLIY